MALISNSSQSYVLTPTTLVSGSAGSAGSSGSSGSAGVMSSAGSCPTGTANVATRSTCTYTANAPQTIMVSTVTTNAAGSAGSAGSGSYLTMLTSGSASSFGSANIGVTRTGNAKTPVQSGSASSIEKTTTTPAGTLKRDPSGQYWIRENLGITSYALEISGPWYTNINEFISLYDIEIEIEVTTTTPAPSASGDVPPDSGLSTEKNKEFDNKFTTMTGVSIILKIIEEKCGHAIAQKAVRWLGPIGSCASVAMAINDLKNAKNREDLEKAYDALYDSIVSACGIYGIALSVAGVGASIIDDITDGTGEFMELWGKLIFGAGSVYNWAREGLVEKSADATEAAAASAAAAEALKNSGWDGTININIP